MDITGKKIFKTSAFGGFKRSDVFEYIETMVNNHNSEISKLKEELKASAAQNIELRQQAEDATKKAQEAEALLAEKEAEAAQLKERVDVYASMEEEYNSNKSRIAELELSAIARASEIEQEALSKARELDEQARNRFNQNQQRIEENKKEIQAEMNKIISDVSLSYNRLISEITGFSSRFDDMINNTKTNLEMLTKSTAGITANFAALEQKSSRICVEETASEE